MRKGEFDTLIKQLGLRIKDLKLLETAFTHRSFLNEVKEVKQSNERLEFLGDVVLAFIISSYLYRTRSGNSEGELTNLRSVLVKTKSLAEVAESLDLGSYLSLSRGEELSGGRQNPQLLANTFEAFLGAIFLDQGLEAAEKVVRKTLLPKFQKELKVGPPKDAKSLLQEVVQTTAKQSPKYKILQTHGPDHARQFLVGVYVKGQEMGRGLGSSRQMAEEQAAQEALDKLKSKIPRLQG